jgi:hypothetical protein
LIRGKGTAGGWQGGSKIEDEDDQLTTIKEAREWQERQKSGLFFAQNALILAPLRGALKKITNPGFTQ